MARYVAFLRAVNLGKRKVAMATAREALEDLGYTDVGSFVNSGNLLFTGTGKTAEHEKKIRARLEDEFGFEITTFVRTAKQVEALATEKPFGTIASGHTHFVLLPLATLSAKQKKTVEAMSNDMDEVVVVGRDVHWLIRAKSTATTLTSKRWRDALPDIPTTARNTTMVEKLFSRL